MHAARRSLIPLAALASTAALLALAGCAEPGTDTSGATGSADGRPECPHILSERYTAPDSFAAALDARGRLSVPGAATNIPEFHDCQRFRVRDAMTKAIRYDSLYAVFLRFNLRQKYREWGARGDTVSIKLPVSGASAPPALSPAAATSSVASGSPTAPPTLPNVSGGLIVALVLAEGAYEPLGFVRGMNCVVLQKAGTGYSAYVIGVGYDDSHCFSPRRATVRSARQLNVTVLRKAQTGIDDGDYPGAARWDWDGKNEQHYIGLPCPGGWCEITRSPDYQASQNYTSHPTASGSNNETHIWRGKGWYDEQHLANFVQGRPVPTGPFATTFPAPKLADRTIKDYQEWKHVATVVMSDDSQDYNTKYQYEASQLPPKLEKGVNVIEMCTDSIPDAAIGASHRRSDDNCGVASERTARGSLSKCQSAWYARVTHDGKVRRVFCVKYRGFDKGYDVPGVVRWRWRADDETIWIRCPTGCCEMDNDT